MPRLNTFISNTARRCEQALAGEFAPLVQAFMGLSDSYHPERHYMRGPGPKWHAKHDPVPASV
jgi:hypothetical protein